MVRDEAHRLAGPKLRAAGRAEDGRIRPVVDDRVRLRPIEPALGVVVAEPVRDEHRVVRNDVGLRQQGVDLVRALSKVALVDPVQAAHLGVSLFVRGDRLVPEGDVAADTRIDEDDAVGVAFEVEADVVAPFAQVLHGLRQPPVATAPRLVERAHVQGDSRAGRSGSEAHQAPA